MSLHGFVIHICLLSILQLFCNGESFNASLKSPKDPAAFPYLSPDRRGNSFAIVDFNVGLAKAENLYQVNLRIEDWENQTYKECSFNVTTKISRGLKIDVKTLRRLGDSKKVVLAWNEQSPVVRRVSAMDLDSCRSSDLGLSYFPTDPIVLPADDGEFHVILANPFRIVKYNSDFQAVGQPREFDVHLEWSSMRVERLRNGDYLAHGFNNRKDFYAYLLDNSTASFHTVFAIAGMDQTQKKFISSGKTLCYNNPRTDTSVNCSQFDDNGNTIFDRPTNFDVLAATPLAVRELALGEFFLLVGDTKCSNEKRCWDLRWAKWAKRGDGSLAMSFGSVKFQCTGDWDSLVLYDMWRSDKLIYYGYGCQQGNRYVYHVNGFLA